MLDPQSIRYRGRECLAVSVLSLLPGEDFGCRVLASSYTLNPFMTIKGEDFGCGVQG